MTINSTVLIPNTIPNTIPNSTIDTARSYYYQGQYAQAWDVLAQAGDRYADNAAGVLGRNNSDVADLFFQKLVKHW